MNQLSKTQNIIDWIAKLAVAGILLQTLFFKFTGAEESIQLFTQLGAEPWGRYASGIAELIASVLLLLPATTAIGALLALGMMVGAIMSHLTVLGIEVSGDGGLLFAMACVVLVCSAIVAVLHRRQIPVVGSRLA